MAARGIKWIIRRPDYGIRAATSHLRRNPRFITQRSEGQLVYSRLTVSIPLSLSPIRFLTRVAVPRVCTPRAFPSIPYYKPTTYPGFSCGIKCSNWCFMFFLLLKKKGKKTNRYRDWNIFFIVIRSPIYRLITIISLDIPKIKRKFPFYPSSGETINNFIFSVGV